MIDKIDRPEAPPPYQITRAKDAKENQHQQSHQREEQEKRYQKQLEGKEWSKFDRRTMTIKPLRVQRDTIEKCTFRAVSLHSGVGTLQLDIHWKDGRTTRGALVLLTQLENFVHLKKFSLGQEVPDRFWSHGATVEFGIIQFIAAGGGIPARERQGPEIIAPAQKKRNSFFSALGLVDRQGKISWGIAVFYLFLLSIVVFVVVVELK